MELYEDSVKGSWQINYDKGMDFFIINDAIIQKICILGDDVEPCFEGASVTAPDVSAKFTLDDKFRYTLYSMMQELKSALTGGGQQMENLENTVTVEEPAVNFTQENAATEVDENKDASVPADFVKKDEEEKEEKKPAEEEKSSDEGDKEKDSKDSSDDKEDDDDDEDDKKKKDQKYELLESKYAALQTAYQTLQAQCAELIDFKKSIDNQQKDALIAEFYMLSDEDKADVISNKQKYSLDEIKAKLAIICFDRKISFASNDEADKKEEEVITYNLRNNEDNSLPDWVKAVKEQEKLG